MVVGGIILKPASSLSPPSVPSPPLLCSSSSCSTLCTLCTLCTLHTLYTSQTLQCAHSTLHTTLHSTVCTTPKCRDCSTVCLQHSVFNVDTAAQQLQQQHQQHPTSILCIDFGPRPLMGSSLNTSDAKQFLDVPRTINSLVNCGSCLPPTKCKFATSLLAAHCIIL